MGERAVRAGVIFDPGTLRKTMKNCSGNGFSMVWDGAGSFLDWFSIVLP